MIFCCCTKSHYDLSQNDKFYFSYYCFFDTSFSFCISNQDTINITQEYHGYNLDFQLDISKEDRQQINNWLNEIDFEAYDTSYINPSVDDGKCYSYRIQGSDFTKSIEVCNYSGLEELTKLSGKMLIFKRKLLSKKIKR